MSKHTLFTILTITILINWDISIVVANRSNQYKSERKKPDEAQMEALLAESQEKCNARRCVHSDQCCPGTVCVDVDGMVGTCLPIYGISEGESCESDTDCEEGLRCDHMYPNTNPMGSVGMHQYHHQRSCQPPGRDMMKKQYNNECVTSSECDSSRGLCCQIIRRHRMAPRKLCYYFSDPQSCIGPVDVTYAKPIHHPLSNPFFKARIG